MPFVMCSIRVCAASPKLFLQKKNVLKFFLLPFGIALLFAGLFFDTGTANSVRLQAAATPTPDRLAEPTLPGGPISSGSWRPSLLAFLFAMPWR